MGHIHLGVLPKTRAWSDVVDLLTGGASDRAVIAASAAAAEGTLSRAVDDPIFIETVRLLAMIPQAAGDPDFGRALRELGVPAPDRPDLPDLLTATGTWLDRFAAENDRNSDFGELSRRALLGTLSATIGADLPGLLDAEAEDVRRAAAQMRSGQEFARAARMFFGHLTGEALRSWLDRTLSTHVGPGRRFAQIGERSAFDAALDQYCAEATRMIREFSGGWYWKTLQRRGRIDTSDAAAFAAVAFKKIIEQLREKRASDA
jgi:hypothetical protein